MNQERLERQANIDKELLQAKKLAFGALDHGKDTLEMLDKQEEDLRGIEDTLEANQYTLDKSARILRGMTWSGFVYNQCVTTKELVLGTTPALPPPNQPSVIRPQSNGASPQPQPAVTTTMTGLGTAPREKDDLDEISSAVATLHKMSLDIGNQLDSQGVIIDKITEKTEKVTEQTLAVTIRASQLSDRARNRVPTHVGIIQLVDVVSGKYLAVTDSRLVLSEKKDRSTYFSCFVKESHLFGLQNEKTLKYVGCAMLGHIIVESLYFGTQEECYIDIDAKTTGILFIARHWGAGAWLKRPLADLLDASTANSNGNPPPHPYLTETTEGITAKSGMIEFRVVRLAAKDVIVDDDK
jgi:hypothetical protein